MKNFKLLLGFEALCLFQVLAFQPSSDFLGSVLTHIVRKDCPLVLVGSLVNNTQNYFKDFFFLKNRLCRSKTSLLKHIKI